ncbi:hypothetical protein QJS10_CPA02g01233 [Acorus calamus]|uniref:Dicer-like protein 4 n=1 Tax=Acorus calamus TaxID=4465 RepID=A0AAV9FAP7_ACOCL|nr:hypothetical protein QJS10_CPA02g01233 [Acorus calamus]
MEGGSTSTDSSIKDPRIIARGYQLELCEKAVEENIIVYLGTGCGKTHIAVLLIHELGHLIRKPSAEFCVFLAPTVPLVRQQAMVIENSTNFKVGCYHGNRKHLKNHREWQKEIDQFEVFVMTPLILLRNLRHCFMKMDMISLLIFDECHHAQTQKRHPYAQIMKEFYKTNTIKRPRIFGMTASPIIGKGRSSYSTSINSLENLLDSKVWSVSNTEELESHVAFPDMKVYFYGPLKTTASSCSAYNQKLGEIQKQCALTIRQRISDLKSRQKSTKLLFKLHENLLFCLENIGLWGALQAARILSTGDGAGLTETEADDYPNDNHLTNLYLEQVATALNCDFLRDGKFDSSLVEALEEPFISKKLSVLIGILSTYRLHEDVKCIIFVKRIIVARSLAYILGLLKCLSFWKCEFLVGFHSGLKNMSRKMMNDIIEKFQTGKVNLLVATNVAEEGLDIQTCCLVIRFDLPDTVASFIQSRGRARMQKSEFVFLVERGNQREEKLLSDFISGEESMNKEIIHRRSSEIFDHLEEMTYKVDSTGATISTGYSVSLLHHYCSKLSHDEYFTPTPEFYYLDDPDGTICRIILPSNAPLRSVDSQPCSSKDEARRIACLKACIELHEMGALTDYLLPGEGDEKDEGLTESPSECATIEDENVRGELHEMLVPATLREPWTNDEDSVDLYFYYISFNPLPKDRVYRKFGLFIRSPLPMEAETMEVVLHLTHGRTVETVLVPSGMMSFDKDQIVHARNFQEMCLKIIFDRTEIFSNCVPLGSKDLFQLSSSTFYLLLPIMQHENRETVDWMTMSTCLSSPVFQDPNASVSRSRPHGCNTLKLMSGDRDISDILGGLVYTPHNRLLFFVDDILHGTNAKSQMSSTLTYADHYQEKFGIHLSHSEQPLLKAKQLFSLHNLLHNRLQVNTESRELEEHFVELPPELCVLKIIGFSKDIGSSLSLLPSIMHRLENLLVAIELKDVLSESFPEGSEVTANRVLESLTTEKCLERFSLERLEVLGDAFLKYAVSRHLFISYEALDEGQLTKKRSSTVNNSHLYDLAIKNNLQVYIRDEWFDPSHFFALGRPCKVVCNKDTERIIHFQQENRNPVDGTGSDDVKCTKHHHWLHRKTIADVVEALVGAFLVDSGIKAACAFLSWIGIPVDFDVSGVYRVCKASRNNLSLINHVDVAAIESLLGHKFLHKGLLLQAFVHPSYKKHSGGCYQRLEFLGDAVLEYLITSYVYSVYPNLKPGQLTDLRAIIVNNNSFAKIAVQQSFHSYLFSESGSLTEAIIEFENFVSTSGKDLEVPKCPKVLGDIIESSIGAILLDTGFDLAYVWKIVLNLLNPVFSFPSMQLSPVRELRELCQFCNFELRTPDPVKRRGEYLVNTEVIINGTCLTFSATNRSSKTARRNLAQEALSALKALGYKHKSKSLEEIVRSCKKEDPELIGFDESPIVLDDIDGVELEKLQIDNSEEAPKEKSQYFVTRDTSETKSPLPLEASPLTCKTEKKVPSSKSQIYKTEDAVPCQVEFQMKKETPSPMSQPDIAKGNSPLKLKRMEENINLSKPVESHHTDCGASSLVGDKDAKGALCREAKAQLLKICAANCWNPPSFVCTKEEGPGHLKMFTYKVIIHVDEEKTTILECFSSPKPKKKAAEDHAAEGALWYLSQKGYAV